MISISALSLILGVLLVNVLAGCIVMFHNSRLSINRWFFILSLSVGIWASSNIVSDSTRDLDVARLASYIAYGVSFLSLGAAYLFSVSFAHTAFSRRHYWTIIAILVGTGLFSTPLVYQLNSLNQYTLGPLYIPYLIGVIGFLLLTVRNFMHIMKSGSTIQRSQAQLILVGISLTVVLSLITNAIIPAFVETTSITRVGPLFTAMFVGLVGYAIVRHRLFNVRMVVARSIAYSLLISFLALLYVTVIFATAKIFSDLAPNQDDYAPLIAALFVLFTASTIKRFFDHLTNRIFYRDAYDPQAFLDQLNKTLVANIEVGILLRHTAQVIEQNIKAECHIYVRETEMTQERIIGVNKKDIKPKHLALIKEELATIPQKTVATDELGQQYLELKNALYINNIAVVSKLLTSYAANHEATAYLILSPKKSGSAYTRQDLRIIDIITDELLIAIQNALRFEEIQSFNITLQNRINDATAKLKRSNEKLKEMDNTKDEFISMASHQLRTPLTSVKGYLSMVLDGDAGEISQTQQQLLNQAYISSQRMVYLIADLLNVSRLKTGKFVIDKHPTNLADMVESEISQLTEVAKSHKLTLVFNKPDNFPELDLDETKTRQVVMNFIDNAIYYTPSGGKIKVDLRADRSSIYLMVKDNGLGVPKEEQTHLFGKFYRASNAQKARPDGTGLGLFMAKKVINDQGGTILFESNEGKGSTFGFKFDRPKQSDNNS